MNIFRRVILMVLCIVSFASIAIAADKTYSDGYPKMYLRGAFNNWAAQDAYLFERQGSHYSLTVVSLDGKFKVGGSEWQCNLGVGTTVDKSMYVYATQDGANIVAEKLSNVNISFDLELDGTHAKPTVVKITVNGVEPDTPTTEPDDDTTGTLPVLHINVYHTDDLGNFVTDSEGNYVFDNEVISTNLNHKNYFQGEYWLDVNDCEWLIQLGAESVGSEEEPLPLEIKARGNWTMKGFAKKPYKIKLGKKQDLLALTPEKSKHYALMAHADDNCGFMRNFVGFNLGNRIGLPWTPDQQPIEVIINGDYRGLYFLTESIRIGDGRVNITESPDETIDQNLISGGYIVEFDNYDEENQIRLNEKSCASGHSLDKLRITFDTPELYSELQRRFISEQFNAMNDLVGANSDALWSYLDLDDAARYYLVKEIISDVEAYHGSTYLFRDNGEGQKWHFSPLWDCGQAFNGPTDGFFYNHDPYGNTWIPSFRKNGMFNDKVEATWRWFMSQCFDGLYDDIRLYAEHITTAAAADYERWKNVAPPSGGASVVNNTNMASRTDRVLSHLKNKVSFLTEKFGTYGKSEPEPVRDTTPAAELPDYAKSGVENVIIEGDEQNAPVEYFDLQGRRINEPVRGGIYIRRQGNQVQKVAL